MFGKESYVEIYKISVGWKVKSDSISPVGRWSHGLCPQARGYTQPPLFLFTASFLLNVELNISKHWLCFVKLYYQSLLVSFLSQVVTTVSSGKFLHSSWILNEMVSSRHCLILYRPFKNVTPRYSHSDLAVFWPIENITTIRFPKSGTKLLLRNSLIYFLFIFFNSELLSLFCCL